jgi:hypothetical protein
MAISASLAKRVDVKTREPSSRRQMLPSVTFTQNSTFGQLSIRGVGTNLVNAWG